jgi:hypothetical protein
MTDIYKFSSQTESTNHFSPRQFFERRQRTAGVKDACKLARAAFTVDIAGPTWLSSLDVRLLHDQACA